MSWFCCSQNWHKSHKPLRRVFQFSTIGFAIHDCLQFTWAEMIIPPLSSCQPDLSFQLAGLVTMRCVSSLSDTRCKEKSNLFRNRSLSTVIKKNLVLSRTNLSICLHVFVRCQSEKGYEKNQIRQLIWQQSIQSNQETIITTIKPLCATQQAFLTVLLRPKWRETLTSDIYFKTTKKSIHNKDKTWKSKHIYKKFIYIWFFFYNITHIYLIFFSNILANI